MQRDTKRDCFLHGIVFTICDLSAARSTAMFAKDDCHGILYMILVLILNVFNMLENDLGALEKYDTSLVF